MAKVMIFIDGSWLYNNFRNLGEDFQIDYGKLPRVIGDEVAAMLGHNNVDIVRTFLFGSNATNYLDEDKDMVKRRRVFYDILREEYGYDVEVHLVDYRNRRLKKKDRHASDDFVPQEKCVDIALTSSMLYFAALPHAYDIAILVGGDRDYIPVLQKVRQLGKRVAIISIHGACSYDLMEGKNLKRVRDFDLIWLNDILDDIQMVNDVREIMCQSPFHVGDNPVETDEFVRKNRSFYCKDCRDKMRTERTEYVGSSSDVGGYDDEDMEENWNTAAAVVPNGSALRTGDSYSGTLKRLMEHCGFIETDHGDFYFGMDDCATDTDFFNLQPGATVEFIVSKAPNPRFRGSRGNGNAEEVALSTGF
ncbi:MAG: NYN domain-containing protein [Saprospiraceae bacterium]